MTAVKKKGKDSNQYTECLRPSGTLRLSPLDTCRACPLRKIVSRGLQLEIEEVTKPITDSHNTTSGRSQRIETAGRNCTVL